MTKFEISTPPTRCRTIASSDKGKEKLIKSTVAHIKKILQDIRNGSEKHISLEEFINIAESARDNIAKLGLGTEEIDAEIETAGDLILRRYLSN